MSAQSSTPLIVKNFYLGLLFTAAIFSGNELNAQNLWVNNSSFPNLPATSCTNTFIDVDVTLGCINMVYNGASVSIAGSTINVTLDYSLGPICLGVIVNNTENINMGVIPAGTYTVNVVGVLNSVAVSSVNSVLVVNSCCSANSNFTASADTICPGDSAYFANTSTGGIAQTWYVNNSQVSTGTNYGQVFSTVGAYDIKLVVSAGTCSDSITDKLYVVAGSSCCPTVPGFTSSQTSGCAGDSIFFTNTSANANFYKWYVGSNMVSNSTNYGQVFSNGGNFKISLVAGDGNCSDSITQIIPITKPSVDLGPDTTICKSANVLLVAGFNHDSIFWSDGSRGPTLTTGPGTIYVDIYKNGCKASDTVVIGEIPIAPADLGPDTVLCIGDSIVFDVTRSGASYQWHNNSTSGVFTTVSGGTFWVKITEANGCSTSDTVVVTPDSCNSGLTDILSDEVQVFPQPAADWLNIKVLRGADRFGSLLITDMKGVSLLQLSLDDRSGDYRINVADLPRGAYVLSLQGDQAEIRKQLIINR